MKGELLKPRGRVLFVILIVVQIIIYLVLSFGKVYQIRGKSMIPTLNNGQKVIAVTFKKNIKRHDIVVIQSGMVPHTLRFDQFNIYDNKFVTEKLNDNTTFEIEHVLVSIQGDLLDLNKVANIPLIVFRYNVGNCNECVTSEFRTIANYLSEHSEISKYLCFFISDPNGSSIADDIRILRELNLSIPLFYVDKIESVELEDENVPYYFSISNREVLKDFFIPFKRKPYLTNAYLDSFKNLIDYTINL